MKNEQEVVEILQANNIKIVYRPVALVSEGFCSFQSDNRQNHGFGEVEMNIYDVLEKLENRKKLKDPFST